VKIGVDLLFLLPGIVGGTETYAVSLLEALGRVDRENEYAIFVNKESSDLALPFQQNFERVMCPVRARSRVARYLWEQAVLPFRARKHRLDLLHSLGYVQPLRLPCASIVTIHDLNFHNLGSWMPKRRRAVLRYFVTRSAKRADHIITVSEFSKRQIVEILGIPESKVTVTYNAVKQRVSVPRPFEDVSKHYGVREPYILALSSFSPHKNMASLVKAFAMLRQRGFQELQLVLAGHPPTDRRSLELLLHQQRIQDAVTFTGYVPDDVLPALYAHAEVFVFPSLYEGFGIPILEAFLHGAPVACSDAGAIPEVACDAACYFDPTSIEEMADAMSNILRDASLRRSLVDRGKERVAQFTWEETARKTVQVYRQIVGGR